MYTQSHRVLGTEQLTDTHTDVSTCIHSYTHTYTLMCKVTALRKPSHSQKHKHSHGHISAHTHTLWHHSSPPPRPCFLKQEGLRLARRSLSFSPSRTLAGSLPPSILDHPPPTKLSAWKLPEFPRGSANQNRLRPLNWVAQPHTLHNSGQCSSAIYSQGASCSPPGSPPGLTSGLSNPSLTWGPQASGSPGSSTRAQFLCRWSYLSSPPME